MGLQEIQLKKPANYYPSNEFLTRTSVAARAAGPADSSTTTCDWKNLFSTVGHRSGDPARCVRDSKMINSADLPVPQRS
jgi:hypothetical protein